LPIITLTSDLGLRDHYVAAIKGTIYSGLPEGVIVDVSNQVDKFNYGQAGFMLRSVWHHFPVGTVHLNMVTNQKTSNDVFLAIAYKGHFFVGPDNGVFSLVMDEKPDEIIQLNTVINFSSNAFPGLNVLVPAAIRLAKGANLSSLGVAKEGLHQQWFFSPTVEGNGISGKVVYIDNYGNAITNISKENFDSVFESKSFRIEVKGRGTYITEISDSYNDVPIAEYLALFNSLGYLEIAQNFGNAQKAMALRIDTQIRIERYDNKNREADFQAWARM
jgi:S-adenosylmethionine hydrolase